jgi:hypothetical protein
LGFRDAPAIACVTHVGSMFLEKNAPRPRELRALGLHLHLFFECAALGDVAERDDDARVRSSSRNGSRSSTP